jgi:hypothetical protein
MAARIVQDASMFWRTLCHIQLHELEETMHFSLFRIATRALYPSLGASQVRSRSAAEPTSTAAPTEVAVAAPAAAAPATAAAMEAAMAPRRCSAT